jgi:GT2 family glycosyltransferase
MKILVCQLIYGNRPHNILIDNELKAGYPAVYCNINTEGIANALNEGVEYMAANGFDAIAFLANDIIEPQNWLLKKVEALQSYPAAGIVASSLDHERKDIAHEMIISNWLISKAVVDKIGYFNESMFPYGPIDLDYCQRAWKAGFCTYYVQNCLALHIGSHAEGNEYGWNKTELVDKYHNQHIEDVKGYHNGTKNIYYANKARG